MAFHYSPHIAVQVENVEAAVQLYEHVLGMERVAKTDDISCGENEVILRKGPITLYVEEGKRGATFFEFKVDDIQEAEAALLAVGCTITQEFSATSKMVADPFGLCFHVWQETV